MKIGKALFVLAATAVLLGALVATASAGRLSSSSQTIRAAFARVEFTGGFGTTACAVTVEGSFHSRTIAKTVGALTGSITRAVLGACSTGAATILTATLPWNVRYASFTGTLPNITRINATAAGVSFQIREPVFGITCLANGNLIGLFNREAAGAVTSTVVGGSAPTSCGVEGTLNGTSNSTTVLNSTSRITVTLI